jgi:hypothetical protein
MTENEKVIELYDAMQQKSKKNEQSLIEWVDVRN